MTQTTEQTPQANDALYNSFRQATFVEKTDEGLVFELEGGQRALVELDEFDQPPTFEAGEEFELLVEQPRGDMWQASLRKAEHLRLWEQIDQLADKGAIVEGDIIKPNKGGLSIDMGLRAFCPRSHIDIHRVDDASPYVGRTENFQIIQFDKDRCNVVLSRKKVIEKERKKEKKRTIEQLEAGQVFTGVVRNIKKYGAFVDIGGIDGLLHVSNMSWGRIDHPSELVRP
ncbi:MAG: S1 RNA-binding domain-containing protein, partial [Persicimonas sp.]